MAINSRIKLSAGASAFEVLSHICGELEIDSLDVLCHTVSSNWRQRFTTTEQRLANLDKCFEYKAAKRTRLNLSITQILDLGEKGLSALAEDQVPGGVLSAVSLVEEKQAHIPMMNLHTSEGVLVDDIVDFIGNLYPQKPGFILSSGRHFHYYGGFLIDDSGWRELIGNFLIAYDFVHPGYCGFRLFDGYSTLRLTSNPIFKPHVPTLMVTL